MWLGALSASTIAAPPERVASASTRRAMPTMMACYIVQYFHHPRQLSEIVRRLVIHMSARHADSNTTETYAFRGAEPT